MGVQARGMGGGWQGVRLGARGGDAVAAGRGGGSGSRGCMRGCSRRHGGVREGRCRREECGGAGVG